MTYIEDMIRYAEFIGNTLGTHTVSSRFLRTLVQWNKGQEMTMFTGSMYGHVDNAAREIGYHKMYEAKEEAFGQIAIGDLVAVVRMRSEIFPQKNLSFNLDTVIGYDKTSECLCLATTKAHIRYTLHLIPRNEPY